MHLKRQLAPKSWPIERKGTTYVVRPSSNLNTGIPILIVLRDILKITQTAKETKRALYEKAVLINQKTVKDIRQSVGLFDVVTIVPSKKSYRLILSEKRKMDLEEISGAESGRKVSKVINKTMLKGKKLQLNMLDGRNYITPVKCSTKDSVVINLSEGKVEKCLPFKEDCKVMIFDGKHAGKTGEVSGINEKDETAEISIGKEKINVLIKQMIVVEK